MDELIDSIKDDLAATSEVLGVILANLGEVRGQLDSDDPQREKINDYTNKVAAAISSLDDIANELDDAE